MEDENMLASVLAHEAAHVIHHHALKSYTDYVIKATFANVSIMLTGTPLDRNLLFLLSVNGFSRRLEKEADLDALRLLSEAGYDPSGLIGALEELSVSYEKDERLDPPIFWRDHPKMAKRLQYVKKAINRDHDTFTEHPEMLNSMIYLERTLKIRNRTCRLNIEGGRFGTATAILDKTLSVFPDDAESLMTMGILIREWARINASGAEEDEDEVTAEDALPFFQRAIELAPKMAVAYRELGELYELLEDKPSAVGAYKRYLQLAPNARDRGKVERKIERLG